LNSEPKWRNERRQRMYSEVPALFCRLTHYHPLAQWERQLIACVLSVQHMTVDGLWVQEWVKCQGHGIPIGHSLTRQPTSFGQSLSVSTGMGSHISQSNPNISSGSGPTYQTSYTNAMSCSPPPKSSRIQFVFISVLV